MLRNQRIAGKIEHAASAYGHVTRGQLLTMGLSSTAIDRIPYLIAVFAGVYAVGHRELSPYARAEAAVLACGEGALLSHDSAAALWGVGEWPRVPEVTARWDVRRAGIRNHRSSTLTARDRTVNYGVPVTSPVRTLLDVARRRSNRELIRMVNDLRLAAHLKPTALADLRARSKRIAALIDPSQNPTRSGLEDAFMAWVARHQLPVPRMNRRRGRIEPDAIFDAEKVIVELDTFGTHGDATHFHGDRARDRANAAAGYLTLRYTPADLTDDEAQRLRTILAARRPQPAASPPARRAARAGAARGSRPRLRGRPPRGGDSPTG